MSDSVWPHRWKPARLPHSWDSPGKNTGVGCHFLLQWVEVKSEREVAQSCPTLSDPMDCSLPGSSIHGIFQARVLEWGAMWLAATKLDRAILMDSSGRSHVCSFQWVLVCLKLFFHNLDTWKTIWLGNLYAEYLMWNAGLDEAQAGWSTRLLGEISETSDTEMIPL